ncbi:J domain-containing protein [Rhodopila sp.]|jgi:hypothetical protein|uniref:J domain-containing protein n=1 Tax=Rhodopila sp. TaxID=2480087 RepID=UPI002C20A092|nr:J domain-containing protein [Rhodopila sp.]HVZ08137.1 J domain-containing protein [Rhodopila sp.]
MTPLRRHDSPNARDLARDPQGYYAALGVEPAATQEAIMHAFRRRALKLHPDVPKTGNKEAFLILRSAYDVLSHPDRRRAYDESANRPEPPPVPPVAPAAHGAHDFRPNVATPSWLDDDLLAPGHPAAAGYTPPGFTPRSSATGTAGPQDAVAFPIMPIMSGVAVAAILCVGVVEVALHLRGEPAITSAGITATAPPVAPQPESAQRAALLGPTPVRLAGAPNFFVVPSAGPTTLWRREQDSDRMTAIGQLPPFSSVQALHVDKKTGLVEIRTDATATAFVEGRHLAPGDADAARRAYCAYNAGPVPYDGEILERRGQGARSLRIENHSVQPAVVKLRDPQGAVAMAVYLAPNSGSDVTGVPDGPLHADIGIGELWSRACNTFAAGLRAWRMTSPVGAAGAAALILPAAPGDVRDIADEAFAGE